MALETSSRTLARLDDHRPQPQGACIPCFRSSIPSGRRPPRASHAPSWSRRSKPSCSAPAPSVSGSAASRTTPALSSAIMSARPSILRGEPRRQFRHPSTNYATEQPSGAIGVREALSNRRHESATGTRRDSRRTCGRYGSISSDAQLAHRTPATLDLRAPDLPGPRFLAGPCSCPLRREPS